MTQIHSTTKINSLSQFFSDSVHLKAENYDNHEEQETPVSAEEEKESIVEIPEKNELTKGPIKPTHFWRTRTPIDPSCKMFFSLVKPQGTQKGTRVLMLYAPPLYALFDQAIEELEMIPSSTKFYTEGRFLILVNNDKERVFSLKVDEKKFYDLVTNKSTDTLLQFFYFCNLNKYLPPPIFLTNPFYSKVVNHTRFYVMFARLPTDMITKDVLDNFVRAIDPILDDVFVALIDDFLRPLDVDLSVCPTNVFLFKVILTSLRIDDTFGNVKSIIEKAKKPQEALVLSLESMQFNDRTKMVLHILFSETQKHFPNMNTAGKLTASIIIASIIDSLNEKNLSSKVEMLKAIDGFKCGGLSQSMYKRYINSLNAFKKQPPSFQLTRKGTYSYDSFVVLINFVWANAAKFVEILEKANAECTGTEEC